MLLSDKQYLVLPEAVSEFGAMVTEATPIVSYPNGTDDYLISVLCDCLIYIAFCLCLFSFCFFCCLIGD